MNHLPNLSFLQSRPAHIELARQRCFEEGQAPTGVVGQAVLESWARCLRQHGNPRERASFQPVTASRTQLALMENRQLHQAWTDELPRLTSMLNSTSCAAMLGEPVVQAFSRQRWRALDGAAHLVDRGIPHVQVLQWVLWICCSLTISTCPYP